MSAKSRVPGECELCGETAQLRVALLRVAWEDRAVMVKTCPSCAERAWRTVADMKIGVVSAIFAPLLLT